MYNRTVVSNTTVGFHALFSTPVGNNNTATRLAALGSNTTGTGNTGNGFGALLQDTTGSSNTAVGFGALFANTTGFQNAATGWKALFANTTGFHNTADGFSALSRNTTGNITRPMVTRRLVAIQLAISTPRMALIRWKTTPPAAAPQRITLSVSGSGSKGTNVSNSCFIGSVFGQTSFEGTAVFINSTGKLGTITSSWRFKEEIKPMAEVSEGLFALKPVTFRYKKGIVFCRQNRLAAVV